jgi:hypothetical protein
MTFLELCQQRRVPMRKEGDPHCRPGWVQFVCPFCGGGGQKFHLGYCVRMDLVNCYKCGRHRLIDTAAALTGLPVQQCLKLLGTRRQAVPGRSLPVQAAGRLCLPKGVGPLEKAHLRYLRGRFEKRQDFDLDETVRLWGLQGLGMAGKPRWSIFLPITLDGQVVSWTTRTISETAEKRYHSAAPNQEAVRHKSLLFGADLAAGAVAIVEGPFDAISGGPGCVATMGTGYTRRQLLRAAAFPKRAVCFDSSETAQRRGRQLAADLEGFPGETLVIELEAADLGCASDKEVRLLRKCVFE